MRATKRALLVAPWAAPLIFWGTTGLAVFAGVIQSSQWNSFWSALGRFPAIALYGLAFAYPATLLIGWPLAAYLSRKGPVKLRTMLLVGLILGALLFAVVGALMVRPYRPVREWLLSDDFVGGFLGAALSGAGVALVFWWIALRKSRRA